MKHGLQCSQAPPDHVDLRSLVKYIVDVGLLSAEHRVHVSTSSIDDFLSTFAPLLSESLAAMLCPAGMVGRIPPAFHVDLPQTLYRMWCELEESSLATVAANIVAEEFDLSDYLVPFNNGMALRSCAEDHRQRYPVASWLPRILGRCVRRSLRHAFGNLLAGRVGSPEVCKVVYSGPAIANSKAAGTLSLAARARALSSDGDLSGIHAEFCEESCPAESHIQDSHRELMVMERRHMSVPSVDIPVHEKPVIILTSQDVVGDARPQVSVARSFTWAAPVGESRPGSAMRPTSEDARRNQRMVSTSAYRLRPERPFSAALWSVPDWAINGDSNETQRQHGWRR